ncbi:F-box/FBD/LRR-repeat protein At1g51370 [Linum perenne]
MKASTIADDITGDHDRISSLPDEILHDILKRLRSHKQAAKYSSVSKRWNHLWLSYPVLEFNHNDYTNRSPSRSTMNSFIAAAKRKFSSSGLNSYIKSLRIYSSDSAFIQAALDLIQNTESEGIRMFIGTDSIIPTQLLNSSRLRTLKLFGFQFLDEPPPTINHHYMKMINLRVLLLSSIRVDNRALNSMISGAPLLEELTLKTLYTSKSVEVCIHANLKHLQISDSRASQIVVGALHSLESLSLSSLDCRDLEIICSSELPSLKSLEIRHCRNLRGDAVNKLISKSPSLLSLHLVRINEAKELKIESPTLEKLELGWWCDWHPKRLMLHIDAPRLVNVRFSGDFYCLHSIAHATNTSDLQAAQSCRFELSLKNCNSISNQSFKELKDFLRKATQQFQFVELELLSFNSVSGMIVRDQVEDDAPTPVVERIKVFTPSLRQELDQTRRLTLEDFHRLRARTENFVLKGGQSSGAVSLALLFLGLLISI